MHEHEHSTSLLLLFDSGCQLSNNKKKIEKSGNKTEEPICIFLFLSSRTWIFIILSLSLFICEQKCLCALSASKIINVLFLKWYTHHHNGNDANKNTHTHTRLHKERDKFEHETSIYIICRCHFVLCIICRAWRDVVSQEIKHIDKNVETDFMFRMNITDEKHVFPFESAWFPPHSSESDLFFPIVFLHFLWPFYF